MKMTKLTLLGLAMMSVFVLSCTDKKETVSETKTEVKQKINDGKTKLEAFVSKKGRMIKALDYNLPKVSSLYCDCKTRVRLLEAEGAKRYFFQIMKPGKYSTTVESIADEDVLEVIKAIEVLKASIPSDLKSDADYMENSFITDDDFKVGYYISKGEAQWYVVLSGIKSETLFFKDVKSLTEVFVDAKNKIESIKNKIQ